MTEFISVIVCFSTGIVISGAIYAFLSVIGLIPRFIYKTSTKKHIWLYENIIVMGGIFGAFSLVFDYNIPINDLIIIYFSFCTGIFVGSLAICLAEVIDVIPVVAKRTKIKRGVQVLILFIAVAKGLGSYIFYIFEIYNLL